MASLVTTIPATATDPTPDKAKEADKSPRRQSFKSVCEVVVKRSVSWGIPSEEEFIEEDEANKRERLGLGYVRRSQSNRSIDNVSPGECALVFEVLLYKRRRIMGGWVLKYCSLVLTCETEDDQNIYHISLTYRNGGSFSRTQKIKGHIISARKIDGNGDTEFKLPCSGCGLVLECITAAARRKKRKKLYYLCAKEDSIRDRFYDYFLSAEEVVKKEVEELPVLKVSNMATDGAKRIQDECMKIGHKYIDELANIYDSCSKETSDKSVITQDRELLREVHELFSSVHDFQLSGTNSKEGGTLQIGRLRQLSSILGVVVSICREPPKDLLPDYLVGNQHREKFNEMLALMCIVIKEFQFGMADLEKYRSERAKIREVESNLYKLDGNSLKENSLEERMKIVLTPPQNKKKMTVERNAMPRRATPLGLKRRATGLYK